MNKLKTLLEIKAILLLIIGIFYFTGCKDKTDPPLENLDVGTLTTDLIKVAPVTTELVINGKVSFNEETTVKVFPMVSGNVTRLNVEIGDYVHKGQVLAEIRSSDVAGYGNQATQAESNYNIAKKNFDAAQDLYNSGLISEREFVSSKNELSKANSELDRANEVLKIVDVDKQSVNIVRAPISGYIVEKFINTGMQIRPDASNNIFTIADLSTIWIIANVYENDIGKITMGTDADVSTMAYSDKHYYCKVDKIFNVLDPQTRTMKIRLKLPNKNLELKPEMYCTVRIRTSEKNNLPYISKNSLVFDDSKYFVLIVKEHNKIEIREVKPYKIVNENVYLNSGVEPGEKYVQQNALFVYNAIKS